MIHAQFSLDRSSPPFRAEAPRPARIVKLILQARDLDEAMNLTMYNVVREGFAAAGKVLGRGGTVGIEVQETSGGNGWYRSISTATELEPWKDSINRVVLLGRPVPRINNREDQARMEARLGLFPDAFETGGKPST